MVRAVGEHLSNADVNPLDMPGIVNAHTGRVASVVLSHTADGLNETFPVRFMEKRASGYNHLSPRNM